MTPIHKTGPLAEHPLRAPVLWEAVWGLIQAASLLGFGSGHQKPSGEAEVFARPR